MEVRGPYHFENPIINADGFTQLLNSPLSMMLTGLLSDTLFQQDGAPPHNSLADWVLLDANLPHSWTGKEVPKPYRARSLERTLFEVLFVGYVNDKVC